MVRFETLFLEKINKIIELFQSLMLDDGKLLSEHGRTIASELEVELHELKKKALDFDKIRDKQKQGVKNNE